MGYLGENLKRWRSKYGLSQTSLGEMVGVSNLVVSKWEKGEKVPPIEIIEKLAGIFNISLKEFINPINHGGNVKMIVITGGPCAGKSTALSWIQNHFSQRGYKVLFIGESATELISSGINMKTCNDVMDFQASIFKLQKEKEKIYYEMASTIQDKVLIVCDRGLLDNKAFLSDMKFKYLLKKMGVNEIEVRDSYDAVFHLVSAAKGAEKFYTLENNSARTETIEEARIVDDKLISAWTGHPHYRIIDNSSDFEGKIKRLINEISTFLNEPDCYEIERKYLIEFPNLKELENMENCEKLEIIQTYLSGSNNEETRIRQRGKDGNYVYYKTIKKRIDEFKRIEKEKRLSKEEYLSLLMEADPKCKQIRKTRYCLTHDKTYYQIDVYPFWNDKAILEVCSKNDKEKIDIPSFINVLKEVTTDERYKNYSLSKML